MLFRIWAAFLGESPAAAPKQCEPIAAVEQSEVSGLQNDLQRREARSRIESRLACALDAAASADRDRRAGDLRRSIAKYRNVEQRLALAYQSAVELGDTDLQNVIVRECDLVRRKLECCILGLAGS